MAIATLEPTQTTTRRPTRGFPPAPQEEVDAVAALYLGGATYAEIARQTGLKPNQIRRRLLRARITLHKGPTGGDPQTVGGATIGELIGAAIADRGYSHAEVARLADCNPSFIWHVTHENRIPRPAYLRRIADALLISPDELARWHVAAGYCPPDLHDWSPELGAVVRALDALSGEARAQCAAQLRRLAEWWLENGTEAE